MTRLGLLTSQDLPHFCPDDRDLISAFRDIGIEAVPLIWDQYTPASDTPLLIRTIWDYSLKRAQFEQFLDTVDRSGVRLLNPVSIVRWNMNKRYMLDLKKADIAAVPTTVIESYTPADSEPHVRTRPIVVKPLVGASGRDTFLIESVEHIGVSSVLEGRPVVIQPFVESVRTHGEYSFMFFGGVFSHAVVKRPGGSEFRVQEKHGGSTEKYEPSPDEIRAVQSYVDQCGYTPTYVRVDVVWFENRLAVMEFEAIEPELFFRFTESGLARYCAVIKSELENGTGRV